MAIAIFQTFSWFNFSVSDPSNEGLRRKMKWPENATTLYFFHWATSKQGQKPTCEIEANPNSNFVLFDMWQGSSRKDHGIFNVFQRTFFSLALWKWSKKDTEHPSHGVFEVFQVEVFFVATSGLSFLRTTPLTPWAAYLRLSWGQHTCKVDKIWLKIK